MRLNISLALLMGFILIGACDQTEKSGQAEAGNMSDLANDTTFQNAHALPDTIDYIEMGEMRSIPIAGQKDAQYYSVDQENSHAVLLMFHEWWGLNDHIKREAGRYATKLPGVDIWALDLYDGKVAETRDNATAYMQAMEEDRAYAIIQAALQQAGINTPVATIGWCFGGGWSLKASIAAGDQSEACVMFYGMPVKEEEALKGLSAPVLGLFARQDEWITPEVVNNFEKVMDDAGKKLKVQMFDANHAFANPSGDRYDEEAAQKANKLAHEFLMKHMGKE